MAALQRDEPHLAELDEKDRVLLQFARKLNDTPGRVYASDIQELRRAELTNQNIFDLIILVAYFNFMNRVADGMGISPEPTLEEASRRHMEQVLAFPEKDGTS